MEIKTCLVKNREGRGLGWANGYVGVPTDHPWYEMSYDEIQMAITGLDIHGGLTFSGDRPPQNDKVKGYWWVGFDTCHAEDNPKTCDKTFCKHEVNKLRDIAMEAYRDFVRTTK